MYKKSVKLIGGAEVFETKFIDGVYFYKHNSGWFFEIDWDYENEGTFSQTYKTLNEAIKHAFEGV